MSREINILFIRHGKTKGNYEGRYIGGRTDEELSENGIALLISRKNEIDRIVFHYKEQALYSSPMKRCIQTSKLLFAGELTCVNEFREMDFGIIEGKNYKELETDDRYREWIAKRGLTGIHQGEHRSDFTDRCMKGFYKILPLMKKNDFKVSINEKLNVITVHGGTIMAILSTLTGQDFYDFQVKNGDGYLVKLVMTGDRIDGISYTGIHDWICP